MTIAFTSIKIAVILLFISAIALILVHEIESSPKIEFPLIIPDRAMHAVNEDFSIISHANLSGQMNLSKNSRWVKR